MLHLTLNFALALARRKKKVTKKLFKWLNFFNVCVFTWYSRFIIKDCSSLHFRESTSITLHNGVSEHHDSWTTKTLDQGATKIIPPPSLFKYSVLNVYMLNIFHFSCTCMFVHLPRFAPEQ